MVQVVAGPRISTYSEEGFALALTHSGDIYSWGKGYKGRLGHLLAENTRSPKLVEALASKNIKMVYQYLLLFILSFVVVVCRLRVVITILQLWPRVGVCTRLGQRRMGS